MLKFPASQMVMGIALCALGIAALLTPAFADTPLFGGAVRDETGVNIHFKTPMPGEMDMIHHLGIGVIRMDLNWDTIEKKQGVYDFTETDVLMKNLEQYHIRPLLILDYTNPLYANNGHPDDPEWRAAFTRWAVATVTHYKGRRILWEMWNEPNWDPNVKGWYVDLALATGQALQAADPQETYIGPAEGGFDVAMLEVFFKAGLLNYWQAISVHPYRTTNPETQNYQPLKDLIKKYEPAGKDIPILSGEWGYTVIPAGNTYSFVTSDAVQADYYDREMLWNIMNGIPVSIWYDWRNDEEKPGATEANFGLVHNPYQAGQPNVFEAKPSYFAASFLLQTLGDYRFEKSVPMTGITDGYLLAFSKKRDHRYAAWTTAPAPEQAVLPLPPGKYTVYDMMGKAANAVTVDKSGLPLTLTGETQFVVRD